MTTNMFVFLKMTIMNKTTKDKVILEFKKRGWFDNNPCVVT